MIRAGFWALVFIHLATSTAWADVRESPTAPLEWQLVEAETALDQGELRLAESHYRGALRELWLLRGRLATEVGDLATAEQALRRARSAAAVEIDPARIELAKVQLLRGEIDEPLKELRLLAHQWTDDSELLEIFIRGLIHGGKHDEAAVELGQMGSMDPEKAARLRQLSAEQALGSMAADFDSGVDEAQSRELIDRLDATRERIESNLQTLQAWTGFKNERLGMEAKTGAKPFGRIALGAVSEPEQIRPPDLDPVRLMSLYPPSFHGAIEKLEAGDIPAAIVELESRAAEGNGDAETLLGWIAASEQRFPQAEQRLLKAVESHPKPSIARQVLARIYWRTDRQEAAKQQLLQAAELGPLDRDLSLWLADLELADSRIPAANRQLRSLDRRFASVEALLRLAKIFVGLNNPKLSMDYLERALKRAPNSEEVLVKHARLALEIGVIPVAAASVEPLARMRPEVAEYQLFLGRVWAGLRKMGEASEALLRAVELDPELQQAFLPLGLALNHESRFEEAGDYLGRYLEAYPGDLEAISGLAEAEQRLGDAESAETRARAVLAEDPDHGRANLVLGLVLLGRDEPADARAALEKAVAADPHSAKAHYQLSLVCTRLRDRACAGEHLKRYKEALKGPESTFQTMEAKEVELKLEKKEMEPER